MNIYALRQWHWVAVGLVVGMSSGVGRVVTSMSERLGGEGFITQRVFENHLRVPPIAGRPYVKDIAVRAARSVGGVDVVSLRVLNAESADYRDVQVVVPRPYKPLNAASPPRSDYTVQSYLKDVQLIHPSVTFHTAWWNAPSAVVGLYGIIGVVIIGGIWPTIICRLPGARHEHKTQNYDLDRFQRHPEAGNDRTLTTADAERLADLEQEMLQGSQAMGEVGAADTPSHQAGKVLSTTPLVAVPEPAGTCEKAYTGEYYPVERQPPTAFTLVELIVVIGIIALLTSILLPTMRIIRLQSETVKCAAQLRQVGLALHMYANANRGWLPAWSGWHTWPPGQSSDDQEGSAWTIEMIPYLGTPDSPLYNCPSYPGPRCRNYFLAAQWAGRSGKEAMKLSDVTMASRFVLSGDKTNPGLYPPPVGHQDADDADPDDFGATGALLWPWSGGFYMHLKGHNVLFDDAHVALFAKYDPTAITFNPHRMEDWAEVTAD